MFPITLLIWHIMYFVNRFVDRVSSVSVRLTIVMSESERRERKWGWILSVVQGSKKTFCKFRKGMKGGTEGDSTKSGSHRKRT